MSSRYLDLMMATPAQRRVRGSAPAPVVPNAQKHCYFYRCPNRAVVWTLDGHGACGRHHQDLARMKT